MPLSESDTRAKLIDPALHLRGWTEDLIKREETAGEIEIIENSARCTPAAGPPRYARMPQALHEIDRLKLHRKRLAGERCIDVVAFA